MHGGGRKIEFLAGDDDQALQRSARHGRSGLMHALSHGFAIRMTPADVWKNQERMPMELPVTLQFVPQARGQWDDAILVALAGTDEQLVLGPVDVVDGQGQALTQPEAADVNEFDRRAIAAKA